MKALLQGLATLPRRELSDPVPPNVAGVLLGWFLGIKDEKISVEVVVDGDVVGLVFANTLRVEVPKAEFLAQLAKLDRSAVDQFSLREPTTPPAPPTPVSHFGSCEQARVERQGLPTEYRPSSSNEAVLHVVLPGKLTADQSGLSSPQTIQAVAELKEALTTEDEKLALAWLKKYMAPTPEGYDPTVSVAVSAQGEDRDQVVFTVEQFKLSLSRDALAHALGFLSRTTGRPVDTK